MEEAEDALRDGDLDGALTVRPKRWRRCATGCRTLARRWPRSSARTATARAASATWLRRPERHRPLGRRPGETARIGSDENMVQNDPTARAGTAGRNPPPLGRLTRPLEELDYLKRLLQMF
jgi:hypothetical protein